MPYKLIVPPEIARAVGTFGLDRNALMWLWFQVRLELEERGDNHRKHRDANNPDVYCWLELVVRNEGRLRGFRFTVDDARAEGYLFLVAAEEI